MKKIFSILLIFFLFVFLSMSALSILSTSKIKLTSFSPKITFMSIKSINSSLKTTNIDKNILNNLEKNKSVRVIIKYKENSNSKKEKSQIFSTKKEILPKEKIHHKFKGMISATISQEDFNQLKNNPNIKSIKIEPIKHIFLQDSVNIVNATTTWAKQINTQNLTGKGQTVCIIDTGVDYNHSDFGNCYGNNNASSSCKILGGWDFVNNDNDPKDDHGHGTHVAGIVSANGNLKGIAPESKIIMIKALDKNGSGYDTDILAGMDWCINNASKFNISVISMSLGGNTIYSSYCDSSNTDFRDAINSAVAKNISVVVATGNAANTSGISSPACIENATRVGDTYKGTYSLAWGNPEVCSDSNTVVDQIVCHANRGLNFADMLLAPGALINSTWDDGSYKSEGGTSMATPMVAGAIAIINQYKKLESNITLTPNQIKEDLIYSGKKINDTNGTNLNFSRIDIYSTILAIDTQEPNITYMFPVNDSEKLPANQSFTCNATDNLQFANLTIKIYNSTSLVYNKSTTQQSLTTYFNTTAGEYNWSCIATDKNSNIQIKTFFLTINRITTKIISPTNNTYTKQNETTFNCSAETIDKLSNITFSIYNSTNLLNTTTKNITGTSNYSTFNYNLTNEGEYYYNCISFSNESNSSQTENYTITYDKTNPKVNLTSPENNLRTTTKTQNFLYNETEENKNSCNLTINGEIKNSFTQTLSDGIYYWNVSCTDLANNTNISETRKLEIYTATQINHPSSGGGSSSPSPRIYTLTQEEIKQGTNKELKENEKLKFKINSENHELKLNSISNEKVNLTLSSNLINLILTINQTKKIDLNNDKIYDLKIKLLGIESSKANIEIKEINETVPTKHIFQENRTNENQTIQNKTEPENKTKENIGFFKKILNFLEKILKYIRFLN